ncbi:hypothetical protein [Nesterenkonia xinjiangensis]|uniref:Uncharacterized protein n=1 Tax=Nesterenkonia xinjiangensis TaxID=225327 RepID=A0A7Z0GNC0_9MICC|nr:hypothetical protein [Nesterenkonia xinjiangensis]NYJ79185.1 hypothetical protein [Nesterenkonia xinjiangensis]
MASLLTGLPTPEDGDVTDEQRERLQALDPGRVAAARLLASDELDAALRAAGGGKAVRVRLDHQKRNDRRAHSTGLTLTLGGTVRGLRVGQSRRGPHVDPRRLAEGSPPEGGAWNLPCGECGAVLSHRVDQLIRAHVEAVASGRRVAVIA